MTKLYILNYFILQWFFIRLCRKMENDKQVGWGILFPIVPTTGWKTNYIPSDFKVYTLTRRNDG